MLNMRVVKERKIYIYSAMFIAIALNMPKLFVLNRDSLLAKFWHFSGYTLLFQLLYDFLFCLFIFYINRRVLPGVFKKPFFKKVLPVILLNLACTAIFAIAGNRLQQYIFDERFLFRGGYFLRLNLSLLLIVLELRIISLLKESRDKDMENERLRNANLNAEMALLKAQLNPHFFFNALSSLSAVVREDPAKAQNYISHLSRVYRYSLKQADVHLVSLKEELDAVNSYAELMKMRYEDAFVFVMQESAGYHQCQLPHMSLQPLVENALKHNVASLKKPLRVQVKVEQGIVTVSNNLTGSGSHISSTGIGLQNLNERCKLLLHREVEIEKTNDCFIVKLPLKDKK